MNALTRRYRRSGASVTFGFYDEARRSFAVYVRLTACGTGRAAFDAPAGGIYVLAAEPDITTGLADIDDFDADQVIALLAENNFLPVVTDGDAGGDTWDETLPS